MAYQYFFTDLLTGTVLEELPLECQSASRVINGVGSLSGSINVNDLGDLDWKAATEKRRTAVWVLRDEAVVVWGGVLWKHRPADNGNRCEIQCESFESLLTRREIAWSYTATDDAFNIVRAIMASAEAQPGGITGITVQGGLSGQSHAVTYEPGEHREVWKTLTELGEAQPGFEMTIEPGRDASERFTRTLLLAAPKFGQTVDPIVAELPGNVLDYDYTEDGSRAINKLTGVGAGEGTSKLTWTETDFADLAAGYPLIEGNWSDTQEANALRLIARTKEQLAARLGDQIVPTVTLNANEEPVFGGYPLGVQCRLRITSPYHPATPSGAPGLDVTHRVTGWTLRPGRAGQRDTVDLVLGRA